mgnify:CR=1 FL=1
MNNTTNTALEPSQFVKYTDTLAAELDTYVKYAIAEQLNNGHDKTASCVVYASGISGIKSSSPG